MEISTLKNKLNDVKKRCNLIYDLRRKQIKVLAKELKEEDELLYVVYYVTGLSTQNYIVLTTNTLFIMRNNKVIEKLDVHQIEITHVEKEEEVMGNMLIKSNKKVVTLKIYNIEIKGLVENMKQFNKDLVFNKTFINKQPEKTMSRINVTLIFILVILIFLSIVSGVVFLMWRLNIL